MKYYKYISDGYIVTVGTGGMGEAISEEEYNTVLNIIHNKPPRTETTDYRLRENLTWEEYPIDPPDPDPEISDAELLDILMGGAE